MKRFAVAAIVASGLLAVVSGARAQETTYLYALTVRENGSVSLKQVQTFSPRLIPQPRCAQIAIRQQPNAPGEWHLKQSGGWASGACQMVGTAEFESMDAFRAYLKLSHVGMVNDEGCSLALHLSLPVLPPNPATHITVALKLPGAEPKTAGAQHNASDKDELIWTFTRNPQQPLNLEISANGRLNTPSRQSGPKILLAGRDITCTMQTVVAGQQIALSASFPVPPGFSV